jgi:hypothetical protein
MTADQARRWLIVASLGLTAATFLFLWTAPSFGYRLELRDSIRLMQIALPVFLGYLGAAAQYVFQGLSGQRNHGIRSQARHPFLSLLIKGPILVFFIALVAMFVSFGRTNQPDSNAEPIDVDQLALGLSAALGILTVTTNVAIAYLFTLEKHPLRNPPSVKQAP